MLQGVTEGFLQIFMVSAEHSRTLNNEFKCWTIWWRPRASIKFFDRQV
jgi:hypothetical protein